jgi:hypothetical protein
VQRTRRSSTDAQDPSETTNTFSGDDGQHPADPGEGLDTDLSYLGHEDVSGADHGVDVPEPATV